MRHKNEEVELKAKISIFHKLMLSVVLVVFIAVGISTYLAVRLESRVLTEGLVHTGTHMVSHIASSTESAFWSLNWAFVEKMLHEITLGEKKEVIFAKVVKPDGEVYLANDKAYYGDKLDASLLFDKETLLDNHFFPERQEKGILLVRPVTIGKERWYVVLGLSLQSVRQATRALIVRNLAWGSLILLLAVIASFFLSKSISRPIVSLAESARIISRGNLDQTVTVKSKDEVGLLGQAFNQMITNLKAAAAELESSEERYRTLIATASKAKISIAVIQNEGERKGVFKYVNQGVADLSGYTREELLQMTLKDIIHPDSYEKVWKLYTERPAEDNLRSTYQFWGVNKKGKKIPVEISTGRTLYDGKNALVCYASDITEKIEAEQQLKNYSQNLEKMVEERTAELKKTLADLQNTQSQLLQSEKMASIGQLAAGVAHEINNPVGFVKSNLGTMNEYREDLGKLLDQYEYLEEALSKGIANCGQETIRGLLEKVRKIKEEIDLNFIQDDHQNVIEESLEGTKRVEKIVSDLKDFAHIDKGELEQADINQGIESTLNIVWNELKYKAEVIKDLGDIPLVMCYPQRLNQVFMNILVNAAQAIEKKGTIKISTRAANGQVEIRISDTGKGISPQVLSKIFDPFFTTKEVNKGTGLGLNVAYNIIQQHKGTIEVESEVGKGTTFTISLQTKPDIAPDG
ncbi:MAG: PAS domain S-box protein [Deltaproteobacteria bacterium]|nr:PAS domain S-box protein [Deltaproteobacteria bacterium]